MKKTLTLLALLGTSPLAAFAADKPVAEPNAHNPKAPAADAGHPEMSAKATPPSAASIEKWRAMRYGMFIHWGPVSLTGKEIGWSRGSGTPVEVYDKLYERFNPVKFNADEWASIAKAAGMRYMVLTCKHHDGFCLWDTKLTDYNIMNTPFKRDVVKELAEACKKQGIAFGVYYSVCDWYHPDFPLTGPGGTVRREKSNLDAYNKYLLGQIEELLTNYGPIVTVWNDNQQEFKGRGVNTINLARRLQPDILINNRTGSDGDYDTPEQRVGGFNMNRPWESCMTVSAHNHWAWGGDKDGAKPLETCLRMLILGAGGDGNVLLNVGPSPEGVIVPEQANRLKEVGDWLAENGESIYDTRGGPWKPSYDIASTRKGDKVYIHLLNKRSNPVALPALPVGIKSAKLLSGNPVETKTANGSLLLTIPEQGWKPLDTIVELTLDGDAMSIKPLKGAGTPFFPGAVASASAAAPGHTADMAVDGDSETHWAAPAGRKEGWLQIDLPKEIILEGLMLHEAMFSHSSRVKKFVIEKKDGDQWTALGGGTGIGQDLKVTFNPVTVRTIRIHITDATDSPTIADVTPVIASK